MVTNEKSEEKKFPNFIPFYTTGFKYHILSFKGRGLFH